MEFSFWHWLAFGVFLLIVELLAPGMFFLWMAQAAAITGVLLFIFPGMGWEFQLTIFSVLSVVSIAVARRFFKSHPIESDQPLLNQRTAQYIGRVFTLDKPIVNGQGKIRVDDSTWKIRGEDCAAGTQVKVIAADSVVLIVKKA
ncbi:MAG: NfeD family protein [Methylococcaceae bacterium]|nr:NfeD family protein [Methylococcaceae bacterium]